MSDFNDRILDVANPNHALERWNVARLTMAHGIVRQAAHVFNEVRIEADNAREALEEQASTYGGDPLRRHVSNDADHTFDILKATVKCTKSWDLKCAVNTIRSMSDLRTHEQFEDAERCVELMKAASRAIKRARKALASAPTVTGR